MQEHRSRDSNESKDSQRFTEKDFSQSVPVPQIYFILIAQNDVKTELVLLY